MTGPIAGVVLAAGASTRLGEPKQLLRDAEGHAMVARTARQLLDAGCSPVLVITGASPDVVAQEVASLPVVVRYNAGWAEGMASSIRTAVAALEGESAVAMLVAACDMPTVTAKHFSELCATSAGGSKRTASSYQRADGVMLRGIPAVLPRADWRALEALRGDRGARDLLASEDTISVYLRLGIFDLDTPADVAQWRASEPPPSAPC